MHATLERTRALPAWEQVFILVALLFTAGAFVPILIAFGGAGGLSSLTESSPANLYLALFIYSIPIALLLTQVDQVWRMIRREPVILLLFALPLLSTFWSDDSTVTFRRAIANAMTGAFCFYLALRLTPQELLRALLWILFIGGVASFLYTAFAPAQAIGHGIVNQGSWSGVFGHKAQLGRVAAIAFFVTLFVEPRNTVETFMRWTTLAMFVVLALFSQSRAGWAMMGLGLGMVPVLLFLGSRRLSPGLKIAVAAGIAVCVLTSVALTAEVLLEASGRNETLSGRTKLWNAAIAVAAERHPDLGSGYRNFWTEESAAGVRNYIPNWAALPGHGHNGYLDMWLELGIPGVVLFVLFLAQAMTRLAARVWSDEDRKLWFGLSLLFFVFLVNNFTASVALKHSDILWVLAIVVSLYANREVHAPALPAFGLSRPHAMPVFPARQPHAVTVLTPHHPQSERPAS